MLHAVLLLALAAPPPKAGPADPAATIKAALADAQRLPADRRLQARYLSLYHLAGDAKALGTWDRVLTFWSNSLSSEPDLVRPVQVAPGLWRVSLDEYGWRREVWEKLLDVEPWFHAPTLVTKEVVSEVKQPYGFYDGPGGAFRQTEVRLVKKAVKKAVKVQAAAFADPREYAALIALTQTQVPVVRADWWIFQTGIQQDRRAGYYDFLNLGNKEADFQRLVGVDVKLARRVKRELRAAVGRSGVTLQNREIEQLDAVTGPYWRSRDFVRSNDDKNILRLLDGDAKFDATEQFGVLPNGLFAYWLGNGAGLRQDAAPDNIASDRTVRGNDRRVHVGRNCVICHQEGLRPIDDWARRIYAPPFSLDSPDFKLQKRLRQIYLGDLQSKLRQGNVAFAGVLKGLVGWTPQENAKAFADAWDSYAEEDRDLEAVAREVGADPKTFPAKVRAYLQAEAKSGRPPDPVLAGLVQGIPARIEHLEELVPLLQQIRSQP